MRYDGTEKVNMDSKAECDQLNLAHVARNKKKHKKETKTNKKVRDEGFEVCLGDRNENGLKSVKQMVKTRLTER